MLFRSYVILPNAIGGVTASAALIFAHTVGEFGVALMIGGSIPGETRVASISIFEHTETLDYGAAGLLSLVLMIVSYVALLFIGKQGGAGCNCRPKHTPGPQLIHKDIFNKRHNQFKTTFSA